MYEGKQNVTKGEKELFFGMKSAMCAAIVLLCTVVFGGAAGYLLWNGWIIIGTIVTLFTIIIIVGLILEQRNASLLITTEGVFQCNFLKREDRILWEKCDSIFKDVRQTVTYIVITQNERDATSRNQIRKKVIMIPWSRFSGEEKGTFLAVLKSSKMSENMKEQFFQEYFHIESYSNGTAKQRKKYLVAAVIYFINVIIMIYGIIHFEQKIAFTITAVWCGVRAVRNMIRFVKG